MRRIRQELPKEECEKILNNATAGVLSVLGDGIPHTRVAVLCMEIEPPLRQRGDSACAYT